MVTSNTLDMVRHCIKSRNEPRFPEPNFRWVIRDAFLVAIDSGDLDTVQWLISAGASVDEDIEDASKWNDPNLRQLWTYLHAAVFAGKVAIVEALLQAGAFVNAASRSYNSIHWGSVYTNYCTPRPLHVAAIQGDPTIVELLLAHGADLDAGTRDDRNHTALKFAFTTERRRGVDSSVVRRYPISAAALLVERGASISGLAAKVGQTLGFDGVLEAFAENPGLWDTFVAGQ
jgi:Ankyrin repeats (many copies)